MTHRATFFLSTGRCGTQWLAKHLGDVYGDLATVAHEPLHDSYRSDPAAVREHVERIESNLEHRDYVETGWPAWATLPTLAERFAGRFAVVHLTRHPVPVACSWVTHTMHCPPILPGITPDKIPLTPFEDGVRYPEYRGLWDGLDPFQRCIHLWTEINAAGLAMERSRDLPWLRVRYEELFREATLGELVDFLGWPWRRSLLDATADREDRFTFVTDRWWDVTSPARLPGVAEVAAALGYDLTAVDDTSLRRRYCAW